MGYILSCIFNIFIINFSVETHFAPITEFFKDLRHYHTEGSVNMYPTMLISIVLQIPCSLLNARVSNKHYFKYLLIVQNIFIEIL